MLETRRTVTQAISDATAYAANVQAAVCVNLPNGDHLAIDYDGDCEQYRGWVSAGSRVVFATPDVARRMR